MNGHSFLTYVLFQLSCGKMHQKFIFNLGRVLFVFFFFFLIDKLGKSIQEYAISLSCFT